MSFVIYEIHQFHIKIDTSIYTGMELSYNGIRRQRKFTGKRKLVFFVTLSKETTVPYISQYFTRIVLKYRFSTPFGLSDCLPVPAAVPSLIVRLNNTEFIASRNLQIDFHSILIIIEILIYFF